MAQLQRLVINPAQIQHQGIILNTSQQHYLHHVLRLRPGDRFIAMNGQGQSWLAELLTADARILEAITADTELPVSVTLLIALPKGNTFDEVVRQITEIGVTTIQPILTARTLLVPSSQKLERWQRIMQEASEQSERQRVPTLLEPIPWAKLLQAESDDRRYLCVTRHDAPHLLTCLSSEYQHSPTADPSEPSDAIRTQSGIMIAIGPEGGWTPDEIQTAVSAGFQPVSLGARVLRAATAPLVAMSLIAAVYEPAKKSDRLEISDRSGTTKP
jgi:16S rRNA (uracil1498-N3)-methyltransferase